MKKKILRAGFCLCLLMVFVFALAACDQSSSDGHTHSFGKWKVKTEATCTKDGKEVRECDCGEDESRSISAKGHTEVITTATPATCTSEGFSESSKCRDCGAIIKEKVSVPAKGHTEVVKEAIPATCTTEGRTESKTCSVCDFVIQQGSVIAAKNHNYKETILTEATCNSSGTKKFTCKNESCTHSYTESYELATYTAQEIFEMSIEYVGEIVVCDKSGAELGLATGFVISSDGRVVTNYHVIDGAYSAKITINGKTYPIDSVLAYDSDIDLAVLKISATNLPYANVCKKSVKTGQTVYAIGSSRGLTNTYSQGIVTYASREVDGVVHVQHDASITNGNSGGPLINAYGEVIGINAWGLTESQNLNFAIFTTELDNLNYGTPMTMAEFYNKECNAFLKLKNAILASGTLSSDGSYYSATMGTTYSNDYESKYTRKIYYYVEEDIITFDLLIDDGDMWAYFVIDESLDGAYYWEYFDDYNYKMEGTLYANTFTSSSLLAYSYNNITNSSMRSSVRNLASSMIILLCMYLDNDLQSVGLTAADLGFYNF